MKNTAVFIVVEIIIGIAIMAGVWSAVYYAGAYSSEDNRMGSIILAGNVHMEEQEYKEAIEKYDEALELDPENGEIKDAIAHAYVQLGSSLGNSDEAITAYEQAIAYDNDNRSAYWAIYNIYNGRGNEDAVIEILNRGYAETRDENMQIIVDNIQIERARLAAEEEARLKEEAEREAEEATQTALLSRLYQCFSEEGIDSVKELIRGEEFIALTDEIVNRETSFYYGDRAVDGTRSGKGVAAYMDGYYYYGDFENDVRSGKGIWIRAAYSDSSALGSMIYEGEWAEDEPNGSGSVTSNYYADRISAGGMTKQVISGVYKNGLENGTMTLTGTLRSGGSVKYKYRASEGVAVKASDEDSGVSGQYIIAKSSDESSNLTSDGSKRGVGGFVD